VVVVVLYAGLSLLRTAALAAGRPAAEAEGAQP
jgi:hypothetical protein